MLGISLQSFPVVVALLLASVVIAGIKGLWLGCVIIVLLLMKEHKVGIRWDLDSLHLYKFPSLFTLNTSVPQIQISSFS